MSIFLKPNPKKITARVLRTVGRQGYALRIESPDLDELRSIAAALRSLGIEVGDNVR